MEHEVSLSLLICPPTPGAGSNEEQVCWWGEVGEGQCHMTSSQWTSVLAPGEGSTESQHLEATKSVGVFGFCTLKLSHLCLPSPGLGSL